MKTSFKQIASAVSTGLVIGCALVFTISQFIWLSTQSTFVYCRDYDAHLVGYSIIYHTKANPFLIWKFYKDSHPTFTHYPPLTYLVSYPFMLAFGLHPKTLYAVSLLWWGALFVIVFFLGILIGQSYIWGALACALFALNPNTTISAYSINLELPLVAMVGLAAYFILKSCGFENRKLSILAGVFCGLAFLTKPSCLIYLGPLCLGVLINKNERISFKSRLLNFLYTVVFGLAIALLFYAPLLNLLPHDTSRHLNFSLHHLKHSVTNNVASLRGLTSPVEIALYFVSFLFLVYTKDKLLIPLFFWSIGSFSVLLFVHFNFTSYLFPIYLGFSLIGVRALSQISSSQKNESLTSLLTLALIVSFTVNLQAEMFDNFILEKPDKLSRLTGSLDVVPRFFPEIQDLLNGEAAFTEEKNAIRVILNKRYFDIPPQNIALVSLHISDMALYERFVWTAFGLDRPQLLSWLKFTAQKRAYAVLEKSVFIEPLKDVDIIIWMGKQCPYSIELLEDINSLKENLSFSMRSSPYTISENEFKNAIANLKLLNECTTKEGEYTFWRGDKACFLKPKEYCFK